MFSLGLKQTQLRSRSSPAHNGLVKGLGVRHARETPDLGLIDFSVRTSFGVWKPAKHLQLLAHELEQLELAIKQGRGYNLAFFIPVRFGKSELTVRNFPAWFLCRNPNRRIIISTYGAELAYAHSRHVRDLVEEHGHDLYDVDVDPRSAAVSQWEIAGARGGLLASGVGGPLTGHGGDLGLIDDPYKNRPEAESAAHRAKIEEWYQSAFATRMEPGAGQVLTMARWHVDDFGAWVQKGDAGEWKIVELAATIETDEDVKRDPLGRQKGESLWPERWDAEKLATKKKSVGSYNWDSLYQQRPRRSDGSTFKRSWFRVFRDGGDHWELVKGDGVKRVAKDRCRTIQIVDLAASTKTTADYFVIGTLTITPDNDILVRRIIRTRVEGPDQLGLLRTAYAKDKPAYIGIEKVAYQMVLVQQAKRAGLPVRAIPADKDKVSRALGAATRYEGEQVFHPEQADWLDTFEQELVDFSNGEHDDQVDIMGHAAAELARGKKARVFVAGVNVPGDDEEDE